MEFNDGSKYRVLTKPQDQVAAGRTVYSYKACGASPSEGRLTVDSAFAHHRNLRNHFKATLLYQFGYIQFSPEAQAEFFFDTLGGVLYPGEMICIDPEAGGGFTAANVYDFCRRWLAIIEPSLKTKAWIYTAKDFSKALAPLTKDRVLWIPRYNPEAPTWSTWDVWQKSDKGPFPGCAEGIGDLNYTSLSAEELLAKCGATITPEKEEKTMPTVEQFLNVCRGELGKGQYEFPVGSNRTKYGKWYGMDGQPWCAMGISWACAQLGIPWRFASTQAAETAAIKAGTWRSTPKPGDIARHRTGPNTGHVGVVEFLHTDGTLTTLEWNTSPDSSGSQRDGDGMYRKRRSRSFWVGYIDLKLSAQEQPNPQPKKEEDMGPGAVITSDGKRLVYVVGDDQVAWEYRDGRTRKLAGKWTSGFGAVIDDNDLVTIYGRGTDGVLYSLDIQKDGSFASPVKMGGHIYPPS
jgi:hypothetical protein